jgi:multiple sugar transport system permease protein
MLLGTSLGLISTALQGKGRGKDPVLLPLVATPVAIGIVWKLFYDQPRILNYVLSVLSFPKADGSAMPRP